jgi:photosystem II stability/assembly factor-like uncharacterized protein
VAGGEIWVEGAILKTVDGGATWNKLSGGTSQYLQSVYFTDANTGYVAGWGGTILKTTNGGSTWDTLLMVTANNLNSVYFTDANTGYAAGDWGKILKTSNAGVTWEILSSGTSHQLESVYFTGSNTGFVTGGGPNIGDNGTILKTTNGGYPVGINDHSSGSNTLKVYPNPASTFVTVESSVLPINSQLSVMNVNGQQLITRQVNQPTTTIDIIALPKGVYFIKMTGERTVEMGKFIKE